MSCYINKIHEYLHNYDFMYSRRNTTGMEQRFDLMWPLQTLNVHAAPTSVHTYVHINLS